MRTYVRRLYAKLGVNNRADLVRKLVSPGAELEAPVVAESRRRPISSLVCGDDTLD